VEVREKEGDAFFLSRNPPLLEVQNVSIPFFLFKKMLALL
jgi:hypothetical protein